jgi:hypothetical protein
LNQGSRSASDSTPTADESALFSRIALAFASALSLAELKGAWRDNEASMKQLPWMTQSALAEMAAGLKASLPDDITRASETVPPSANEEHGSSADLDEWQGLVTGAVTRKDLLELVGKASAAFSLEPEKLERLFQVIRKRKEQLPKGETR